MNMYYYTCNNCHGQYDACDDCVRRGKEDFERDNKYCKESIEVGNTTEAKDCKLKTVHHKLDACTACGYQFVYP